MVVVGLTGDVGAGKSTLAHLWSGMGATVVSADAIVARLWNSPDILDAVRKRLGPDVFDEEGRVRRSAVAERVFADDEAYRWLNGLFHPPVLEEMERLVSAASRWVVAEIPSFSRRECPGGWIWSCSSRLPRKFGPQGTNIGASAGRRFCFGTTTPVFGGEKGTFPFRSRERRGSGDLRRKRQRLGAALARHGGTASRWSVPARPGRKRFPWPVCSFGRILPPARTLSGGERFPVEECGRNQGGTPARGDDHGKAFSGTSGAASRRAFLRLPVITAREVRRGTRRRSNGSFAPAPLRRKLS